MTCQIPMYTDSKQDSDEYLSLSMFELVFTAIFTVGLYSRMVISNGKF